MTTDSGCAQLNRHLVLEGSERAPGGLPVAGALRQPGERGGAVRPPDTLCALARPTSLAHTLNPRCGGVHMTQVRRRASAAGRQCN